jgi:hypothetical protein
MATRTQPPSFMVTHTNTASQALSASSQAEFAAKLRQTTKASQAVDDSVLDVVLKSSELTKPANVTSLQRQRWYHPQVSLPCCCVCQRVMKFRAAQQGGNSNPVRTYTSPSLPLPASTGAPEGMRSRKLMVEKYLLARRSGGSTRASPHPSRFQQQQQGAARNGNSTNSGVPRSTPSVQGAAAGTAFTQSRASLAAVSSGQVVEDEKSLNWMMTPSSDGMFYASGGKPSTGSCQNPRVMKAQPTLHSVCMLHVPPC